MLKHRLSVPVLLGGCLVVGVLFTADVLLAWDAAQHFALAAPAPLRWGVWLALGVGAFALSRTAAVRPAALLQPHKPLGALMLLLAKVFLVPGLPCGHTLFAVGVLSFLFCTCMELPLTLVQLVTGPADLTELLTALPLAAVGLCGAVCAAACLGPDTVE